MSGMNRTDRARRDVHRMATGHRVRDVMKPGVSVTWTCVHCPAGTPAAPIDQQQGRTQ